MPYICLKDETGEEIPGSRRDYTDRAGYIAAHAELTRALGEGCWVFDSERD